MLEAADVTFTYRRTGTAGPGFELGPLSFTLSEGESIALVGTSGCGKSTLLRLLSGALRSSEGSVFFGDRNLATLTDSDAARLRRTTVGVIHQDYSVLPFLTAEENITLPSRLQRRRRCPDVAGVLEEFGIGDLRNRPVATLSGGQQQRVAIARAVYQGAELLLCDEPTGALDAITAETVSSALYRSLTLGVRGLVISTHDVVLAAKADRVFVLSEGQIGSVLTHPDPSSVYAALRHHSNAATQTTSG